MRKSSQPLVDEMIESQLTALSVRYTRDADATSRLIATFLGWLSVVVFFVLTATVGLWATWPTSLVAVLGLIFFVSGGLALIFALVYLAATIVEIVASVRRRRLVKKETIAASQPIEAASSQT